VKLNVWRRVGCVGNRGELQTKGGDGEYFILKDRPARTGSVLAWPPGIASSPRHSTPDPFCAQAERKHSRAPVPVIDRFCSRNPAFVYLPADIDVRDVRDTANLRRRHSVCAVWLEEEGGRDAL